MSGVLKMPRMGETMEEGTLAAWLVEPGQPFKRGDPILEVETDKTVVEYPALGDGALVEPLVELGEMVSVGMPIARIDVGDGPDWTDDGDAEGPAGLNPPPVPDTERPKPVALSAVEGGPRRATPLARRLAAQNGLDIETLRGTGRRGRIEKHDVEAALSSTEGLKIQGLNQGHGIAWLEKGPADGTLVLLIHGFAADHSAWAGLQSHMARQSCRTVAVDLPSHGAAALDMDDVDNIHAPLGQLARQLGGKPIHFVAHSMGALAAVQLAQTHPVASLTLIAPAGVGRRINAGFLTALAAPKNVDHLRSTLKRLTTGPNGLSETAISALFNQLRQGRVSQLAQSLAGASGQAVDMRTDLAALAAKVPVRMILGHRDQVLDWSEALEVSPLISVHHLPDAGHMPHWEAPIDVQRILERAIKP